MKFNENKPIYVQLRNEIEQFIISDEIEEEEMLPSIRKLAQDFRINPQTVIKALSSLIQDEYIFKKRGIGFFVSKGAKENLRKQKIENYVYQELKLTILNGIKLGLTMEEIIKQIKNFESVLEEK
jgi:DNA-binding transcriptional regulator YhcF (GntR family)